ncbi:MAG: DUF4397 domain-containing protein [Capsulimonadaceae bacterium]
MKAPHISMHKIPGNHQKQTWLLAAVVSAAATVTGCGSTNAVLGGAKSTAQIRAVDVATNTVNTSNNIDTATVLVNGGASYQSEPYATPSEYEYIVSGGVTLEGSTSMTLPTVTVPSSNGGTPTTTTVQPPNDVVTLATNGNYTAYLVGRPDVPNPTQSDLSDLDPRFLRVVVLRDNNLPSPPSGQVTVRFLSAICDPPQSTPETASPGPPPNVDVYINGTKVFSNVPYATQTTPSTTAISVPSGQMMVGVDLAGTSTVIVPPTPITVSAGDSDTVVAVEPTAVTQTGVVPPNPPAGTTTYGLEIVHN